MLITSSSEEDWKPALGTGQEEQPLVGNLVAVEETDAHNIMCGLGGNQ